MRLSSSCLPQQQSELRYKALRTTSNSPSVEGDSSELAVLRQRLRIQARTIVELREQLLDSQSEARVALTAAGATNAAALKRTNITIWKLRRSLEESGAATLALQNENSRLATLLKNANRVTINTRPSCRRCETSDVLTKNLHAPKAFPVKTVSQSRVSKNLPLEAKADDNKNITIEQLRSAGAKIAQLELAIRDMSEMYDALKSEVKSSVVCKQCETNESQFTFPDKVLEGKFVSLSLADEIYTSTQSTLIEPREVHDASEQAGVSVANVMSSDMQTEPMELLLSSQQLLEASRTRLVSGAEFQNAQQKKLKRSCAFTFYWCSFCHNGQLLLNRWSSFSVPFVRCIKVVRSVAVVESSINCQGRLEIYTKRRSRLPYLVLEGLEALAWHFALQCVLAHDSDL